MENMRTARQTGTYIEHKELIIFKNKYPQWSQAGRSSTRFSKIATVSPAFGESSVVSLIGETNLVSPI
jgi:hypothetical protein